MVLLVEMPHHQVEVVIVVAVVVLVVEELLLFMREHTPIMELYLLLVEKVVVVDLIQQELPSVMTDLEMVEQEQLLLSRLMQHNIKV
jgi:hypothetical protein|tara:strand:+ start:617 stop:877 length:261 start_codon:yes stop_codon:yes gene_type:complete